MEKMLRDKRIIFLFLLPCLLLYGAFVPFPALATVGYSLFNWNLIGSMHFTGVLNFYNLFTNDPVFIIALKNTFLFLVLSVILQIPAAFFIANALAKKIRFNRFFQNVIFMPVTLSGVAVALMWYFIYHPEIGFINGLVKLMGVKQFHFPWLFDSRTSLYAVIISVAWQWIGYHMMLFIAGIRSIPSELYEAAKIDGASEWDIVKNITFPLVKPVMKVSLVLITTSSFKSFDSIFVMTGGGPAHATEVLASHMYYKSFMQMNYGYGCSVATVLFAMCVMATAILSGIFKGDSIEM
ncbi:MAG TPA: sugar ABC transporter permease [Firmicutes bacterium]|jgi:raffinose/stachyose/melibiose transport system permease protein|nr:sugar ABC transporter permease [Bacillota bacterium]